MESRVIHRGAILSATLFVLTAMAFFAGPWASPWDHRYISFSDQFHVGLWSRRWQTSIVFFNDVEGPYTGSIIGLEGDPNLPREWGYGMKYGVYYRYFLWPNNEALWTLSVSLWYGLAIWAILPAIWLFGRICTKSPGPAHEAGD